jgi:dihydroorotate dehydrogenase electron transfer subunit
MPKNQQDNIMSKTSETQGAPEQTRGLVSYSGTVTEGVHLLWIEAPEVAATAYPGQFAMLKCGDGAFLRRPLSIHRVSEDKTKVAFLFALIGKGTGWLAQARVGDRIDILGPLGKGFNLMPSSREILLLAGGLGLAPLVFLAERAVEKGVRVNLAYGTATDRRYSKQLLPEGIRLLEYTDDGACGRKGLVTECVPDFLDMVDQIFVCGPLPMYRALSKQKNLRGKNVQVSLETRMACGLGVCYGCTIKTTSGLKQVCRDGPVFDLDEVVWAEMAGI